MIAKYEERKWGTATIIVNNRFYCGKILRIKKGFRTSLQYHKIKDETLYVQTGCILMEYEKNHKMYQMQMYPGEIIRIRPHELHRFTGLCDSEIFEVSTQHLDDDKHQMEEGGRVPDESIVNCLR